MPGVGGGDVAKEWAKAFYNSKAWQQCRDGYIQTVQGLCERHLKKGMIKPGKIVHHKILLTLENINDPNVTLSWENLELVCQDCHNNEHHSTDATANGLTFDENGELVRKQYSPHKKF
jgi:5-methylcytosine-specific restriction protein A